jgi:hypothetical protein
LIEVELHSVIKEPENQKIPIKICQHHEQAKESLRRRVNDNNKASRKSENYNDRENPSIHYCPPTMKVMGTRRRRPSSRVLLLRPVAK